MITEIFMWVVDAEVKEYHGIKFSKFVLTLRSEFWNADLHAQYL